MEKDIIYLNSNSCLVNGDLERVINSLSEESVYAIDTETTGLSAQRDKLCLIQIATENQVVIIHYCNILKGITDRIIEAINKEHTTWILHNAKFDIKFLMVQGYEIKAGIYDTMLAETCILQGESRYKTSLKVLVSKYLGIELDKEQQQSNWSKITLNRSQLKYAVNDVIFLHQLMKEQSEIAKQRELQDVISLENNTVLATARMELAGVMFDIKGARALNNELVRQEMLLAKKFENENVNPNSAAQLLTFLHNHGVYVENTKKDTLVKYANEPDVQMILRYKNLAKKQQSISTLVSAVDGGSKRITSCFSQNDTSTGRYTCSKPNLQGIPHDIEIRKLIVAPEGKNLVIGDYSQMELRILAEVANDISMIRAYQEGLDLHTKTASIVNGKPYVQVTAEERKRAKAMNFGLIYGMKTNSFITYAKVNYDVEIAPMEASDIVGKFFEEYQSVDSRIYEMTYKSEDYEKSLSGRTRIWSVFPTMNERCNYTIQATGADILKTALAEVEKKLLRNNEAKLILTVHDEIVLEVDEANAEAVSIKLKEIMEKAGEKYIKKVPIIADISIGENWAAK